MPETLDPALIKTLRQLYGELRLAVDEAVVALDRVCEQPGHSGAAFKAADRKVVAIVRQLTAVQDR